MRNTIAKAIKERAKSDKRLFLIAGDAGLGVWDEFRLEYKNQYINPGVNEALCIGMAAGMALLGHKVIYYNIAPFVIMRPYEQVRNDICYQELPVILIGTGSGLTYAPAGMTHYAIEDIALARTCPNLDIFSPADPIEALKSFEYAYNSSKPSYIRIPKSGEPRIHENENIDITKPILVKDGKEVLIFTHSSIVSEALQAAKNRDIAVATLPMISAKCEAILEFISGFKQVLVLEEHFKYGALGEIVREIICENHLDIELKHLAIKNEYVHEIGNREYLRSYYKIDANAIIKELKESKWASF